MAAKKIDEKDASDAMVKFKICSQSTQGVAESFTTPSDIEREEHA